MQCGRFGAAARLFCRLALPCIYLLATPALGAPSACPGDLDGNGRTTVDEIVAAVDAALSGCPAAAPGGTLPPCPGDLNGDGLTTVDEVVMVINAALTDCGFNPLSVSAAVTKVKTLLVGLPATDAEVKAVAADHSALSSLVCQWMTLPAYRDKMLRFFITQFQQDQFQYHAFDPLFDADVPFAQDPAPLLQNLEQSFARTVLELIDEGQPFTSTMTTTRFMMTPALMAFYATLDVVHVDDASVVTDLFQLDHPTHVTLESSTAVPLKRAQDPAHPDRLTFYDPTLAMAAAAPCPSGTLTYPFPAGYRVIAHLLFDYERAQWPPYCDTPLIPPAGRYIRGTDFTAWKMVTVRQPRMGESTTQMYDLPAMRAGNDLVLHVPRVGFFTTPAFAARWPTNADNQARVLLNQTLIVALGHPIDLTNTTPPPSLAALNEEHAAPGTTCYACHQALDPMRQFFRHTYTLYFSQQDDPTELAMNGQFAFHGVSAQGERIGDLGTLLAGHPLFATAWVQKLCTYATSQLCDETDPEFRRLVKIFTDSNYSWNALVKALFASPLVTYLEDTQSVRANGESFPIARQAHLCAALSNRLGLPDVCGLDAPPSPTPAGSTGQVVRTVAATWPSDQYSRGNPAPVLANNPSMLMRGGLENLCADLAQHVVDQGDARFQSADPTAAIDTLVTQLMGLTSDRASGPRAILQGHFAAALQSGASPTEALQSTFVLACLSPYVAGVGF